MNELNLTSTETLILISILLYLLWKLWRYENLIELDEWLANWSEENPF